MKSPPSPADLSLLPPDGGPDWNRLVFERSPYLLQHAANPVDWWPWGDAAFEEARRTGKPVFLSVGYATCHWCHVMERESFEDDDVAKLMNDAFVCVKVDREERPDVDHAYMTITQALTGSGGWPMTVLLTPDREAFFAGTYFPKSGRHGRPGMLELVPMLRDAWRQRRDLVVQEAGRITEALRDMTSASPGGELAVSTLEAGRDQLASRFDRTFGGFGHAPKFPTPHQLSFLLRWHRRSGDQAALEMVQSTFGAMRRGGLFDHVGFGYHRYSTDREWLVPHFEKMLYDQALLLLAASEAWQVTKSPQLEAIAREIATYVLRDMTSPEGGFYSAEDADSEGEEGLFYTWPLDEAMAVLGEDGPVVTKAYHFTREGNYHDEATRRPSGRNIPHLGRGLVETARELGMELDELHATLERGRLKLFAARSKRIRPLLDDKVLTDWNGLMIAALGRAGAALDVPEWIAAADRAADFVLAKLRGADGRLLKRWRAGEAGLPPVLDDYAFMTWGLVSLYRATFEPRRLEVALELARTMLRDFHDDADGALFLGSESGEKLPVRGKESYDGAIPSGNSVAALALVELARLTGEPTLEARAGEILAAYAGALTRMPSAHCQMLAALDMSLGPSHEIVVAGRREAADTRAMLRALQEAHLPNAVVLLREAGADDAMDRLAPFTTGMAAIGGKATAFACSGFACSAPTTDVEALLRQLAASVAAE